MKKFQVGDAVICVDTRWTRLYPELIAPVKNKVYTIRRIDGESCLLVEIINKPVADRAGTIVYDPNGSEPIFYLWHFEKYDKDPVAEMLEAIQKMMDEDHGELFHSEKCL